MQKDELYMHRCIALARLGSGNVAPNPMVGAVLVYNDRIIGEGYHENYGQEHAEVNCINNVREKDRHAISESTLYVSLEPCNHFGKTPPCTSLIFENGIKKVVIACTDSFKEVNGKGIEKLRENGVDVIVGILKNEAINLNKLFFTFHAQRRPYIILKWAQSANGKIGSKNFESIKISNIYADRIVHKWRAESAAIMVGTNTALYDDPSLTTRLWPGKNPVRVLVDRQLRVPEFHKIYSTTAPVIVFNYLKEESIGHIKWVKINSETEELETILSYLYHQNIQSLFVEGGALLLQSFIDGGLWDEARIITNGKLIIQEGTKAPVLNVATHMHTKVVEGNEINIFEHKQISR